MKKTTKTFSALLIIVVIIGTITSSIVVSAATNPYGKWQTISGVDTIRCTYYAWQQAYDNTGVALPNFGNAKNWYTSAKNAGYPVGTTAKEKSIAVWTNSGYGHVGYVTAVNGSKMTVNEGGMLNTDGTAYNGNGIINGSTCNSTVGSNKSSYSSSVLVGFIYLTENTSSSVSLSFESSRNSITNTNAIIYGRVDKPSNYAVTKIGIKIRKEGSTYSSGWSKYEAPSQDYVGSSYMLPYYNMNEELNLKLNCNTKYYYKFFAIVNNVEYWSKEESFTTTGSHSFGSWSTATKATCESNGSKYRTCKTCSFKETKSIGKLGHDFSSDFIIDTPANCGYDGSKSKHCSRCSAKSNITTITATNDHSYSHSADKSCNVCGKNRTIKGEALIKEADGKWYYYKNGIKTTATKLVKYNGKWFYIKNGKWDNTADTLMKINGKWFLIKDGKWSATTGIVKYKGKSFYVKGGKWSSSDDTLYKKNGKYYAIKNGKWYKSKAIIKYSGKKYYVNKGYAQLKFSGKAKIGKKTYTIKKGIVK